MKFDLLIILFNILYLGLIIYGLKKDFSKNDKLFIKKKILDSSIYFLNYVYIVIMSKTITNTIRLIIFVIPMLVVLVYSLVLIFEQIVLFNKIEGSNYDRSLISIFVSLLIGIIFSFSSIYYIFYIVNPSWFVINDNFGVVRLAFEFVYYTFSITITYSSDTITAYGVIPKIVQMGQIIIFYLFAGNLIISSIEKMKE